LFITNEEVAAVIGSAKIFTPSLYFKLINKALEALLKLLIIACHKQYVNI
jgi:hypothetical protein